MAPIVPGDPDKSEIIARISASGPRAYAARIGPQGADGETEGDAFGGGWPRAPSTKGIGRINRSRVLPCRTRPIGAREESDRPLHPAPPGPRRADAGEPRPTAARLLRRVTLDLTGVPPTPDEMRAFLADSSPDAYEKAVDRLLASPRYAEQQTMHWLDAVRYADTCGFHGDNPIPAWPYRDYVLRAFARQQAVRRVHARADSPAICCRMPRSSSAWRPPTTA